MRHSVSPVLQQTVELLSGSLRNADFADKDIESAKDVIAAEIKAREGDNVEEVKIRSWKTSCLI